MLTSLRLLLSYFGIPTIPTPALKPVMATTQPARPTLGVWFEAERADIALDRCVWAVILASPLTSATGQTRLSAAREAIQSPK
jgi:hypothetical protein